MSVTVVSTAVATIAKPPAAAEHSPGKLARDDGADASQGFAGVLSGQLAPTPPATLVGENSRPASSADVEPELPADNAAAGLMAALGLVPASGIQVRSTAPASPPLPTATTLASLAPAQAAGAASAGLPDSAAALDTASDRLAMAQSAHSAHSGRFTDAGNDALAGKADAAIAAKAMSDDKSAIIAAASLPRTASTTETPATRSVALEAVYGALPPPTPREAALAVTTPVRDAGWAAEVADKIVWLAANDRQSAKLTLNPAHLGPLEISLHIDKGHATAAFVSASAEVRDALETALPRLREMFASAGITLGQTNVSAESFSQQANAGNGGGEGRGPAPWAADAGILVGGALTDPALAIAAGRWGKGMVDTFA